MSSSSGVHKLIIITCVDCQAVLYALDPPWHFITVLPHMRILAHTRMGRPMRVWDIPYAYMGDIMSHARMGYPVRVSVWAILCPIRVWAS